MSSDANATDKNDDKTPKKRPQFGRCFVESCVNYLNKRRPEGSKRVHYFSSRGKKFDDVRDLWVKRIPPKPNAKDPKKPVKFNCYNDHHHLCTLHFQEKYIMKDLEYVVGGQTFTTPLNKWRLKEGAVPTIFPRGKKNRASKDYTKLEGRGKRGKNVRRRTTTTKDPLEEEHRVRVESPEFPDIPPVKGCNNYLCSICLDKFSGGVGEKYLRNVISKKAAYLQFVRAIGKYLGLDLRTAEHVLGREDPERMVSLVCNKCRKTVEGIYKLFKEFEVAQMKLDSAIWRLNEEIFETGKWAERREELGEVQTEKVQQMLVVADGIQAKRKNIFRKPQVLLRPLEDEREEEDNDKEVGEVAPRTKPDSDIICGRRSSLLKVLGFNKEMFNCHSCHKCYPSGEELRRHKMAFHSALRRMSAPMPESPSTESASENEEYNDEEGLPPPSPVEPNEDTNMEPSSHSPLVAPPPPVRTPKLVLNDNLIEKGTAAIPEEAPTVGVPRNNVSLTRCPSPAIDDGPVYDISEPRMNSFVVELESPRAVPMPPVTTEMEVDEQKEDTDPTPVASKKIPFMSSEYIGKYKILCKLKNITTGETCRGVVAKLPGAPTTSQPPLGGGEDLSSPEASTAGGEIPKVISVEPEPPVPTRKLHIPGPPFKCLVPDCSKVYLSRASCLNHYLRHKRKLNRIQKLRDAGEEFIITKTGAIKLIKKPDPPSEDEDDGFYCQKGCRRDSWKFKDQTCLDLHYIMIHTSYPCNFCPESIQGVTKLISHELSEHLHQGPMSASKASSEMTCSRCTQVTGNAGALRNHFATTHLQIKMPRKKNPPRQCGICKKEFCIDEKYVRHMSRNHGEEGEALLEKDFPFKCDQCEKRFSTESGLKKHKKFSHGRAPRRKVKYPVRKCPICGKVFTRHRYLFEEHVQSHADEDEGGTSENAPEICETCGKSFRSRVTLRQHKRTHHGPSAQKKKFEMPEEGLVCHHCGKRFTKYLGYRLHLYYHSTDRRQYPCQLCGKMWPNRAQLEYHLRRVHPEEAAQFEIRPENGVVCHQCGKMLANKYNLRVHLKYCPVSKEMNKKK